MTDMNQVVQRTLASVGCVHLGNELPKELVAAAKHRIDSDLFGDAISRREILWWSQAANWFPHLRFDPAILALRDALPEWIRQGEPCEPQILIGLPDAQSYEPHSHIDKEPEWANGRKYNLIVGVPLTITNKENGNVRAWSFTGELICPSSKPGDVFVMHPDLPHSGGSNLSGGARYVVYFRWLK